MNILLINPSQREVYGGLQAPDHPPMGLAYIAATLETLGCNVEVIDMDADNFTKDRLGAKIEKGNYVLAGITVTTPLFKKALDLATLIKERSSGSTKVVLGGIHATISPIECIKYPCIDFVVKGEGEGVIKDLIEVIRGSNIDYGAIDGLLYKQDGAIIHNRERDLIPDLDLIPFPARHLFNHKKYTYPDALYYPTLPIITSRGCPGNCTYCNTKNIFTRRFRVRSPKNVVDEIEFLVKEYGAKEIHIWDDNFTTQRKRVYAIRDEIKKRDLSVRFAFPNGLRVDYVGPEILKALKEMGVYSIAYGVESGSQMILDRIKKGIKLERIEKTFEDTRDAGLETWAFFMLGLPSETINTINETINFAIKLDPDIAKFHLLKPYPGSEVYKEFSEKGLILDNNLEHYGIHTRPVHSLPGLTPDDLLYWQKVAYKRFYLRPGKLFQQIVRLKSYNRVRLNLKTGITLLKKMIL